MKKMRVMAFLLSATMVLSEVPAGYVMAMENEVVSEITSRQDELQEPEETDKGDAIAEETDKENKVNQEETDEDNKADQDETGEENQENQEETDGENKIDQEDPGDGSEEEIADREESGGGTEEEITDREGSGDDSEEGIADGKESGDDSEEELADQEENSGEVVCKEADMDEKSPELNGEMVYDHHSSSLDVDYHTQSAIANFINQSRANSSLKDTFEVEPVLTPGSYAPGKMSEESLNSAIDMLNQIRYIAGLPYHVALDNECGEAAALTCLLWDSSNHKFDADDNISKPEGMDDDYYQKCKNALHRCMVFRSWETLFPCNQSALTVRELTNFRGDRDDILDPLLSKAGFCSATTDEYFAARSTGAENGKSPVSYVAWPAQNMPSEYYYWLSPWSVSIGSFDVDKSTVSVKLTRRLIQKTWNLSKDSADATNFDVDGTTNGFTVYFLPNIEDEDWHPDFDFNTYSYKVAGEVYDVEVTYNTITDHSTKHINYTVRLFDLEHPDTTGEEPTYKIQYVLNGGSNHFANPTEYMSCYKTITLKEATRKNYVFGGWYSDPELTKEVKQIEAGSEGDITLYAKWINDESLQDRNIVLTNLRDVEGEGIPFRTNDGKPAIYIFGDYFHNEDYYRNLLQTVNEMYDEMDADTNIYFIHSNVDTGYIVADIMKRDAGFCDHIIYSKIDSDECKLFYEECTQKANGLKNRKDCCIFFKNKQNMIVEYYKGEATKENLQVGLRKAEIAYNDYFYIKYELNGGKNHLDNPVLYQPTDEKIILKNPTKSGYRFEGWYKDKEYKEAITEIEKGTTGDFTLYAKWIFDLDNSILDAYKVNLTDVRDSSKTKVLNTRDQLPAIYVFGTWSKGSTDINKLVDISQMLKERVTDDTQVYAMDITDWNEAENIKDAIAGLNLDSRILVSANNQDVQKLFAYLMEFTEEKKTYESLSTIFFKGADNKLKAWSAIDRPQQEIIANMILAGIAVKDSEEIKVYRIIYEIGDEENAPENPLNYTNKSGIIRLEDAVSKTKRFRGWYLESNYITRISEIDAAKYAKDLVLYAKWEQEEEAYADEPLASHESGSKVDKGTKITLSSYEKGTSIYYSLNAKETKWKFTLYKEPIEILTDTTIRAFAKKSGMKDSPIVEFQYWVGQIRVTFDSNGGTEVTPVAFDEASVIDEPAAPTRDGYRFVGWYLDGKLFDFQQKIDHDITLVAKWEELSRLSKPVTSIREGEVEEGTKIKLGHADTNVVIRYTVNGTEPTEKSGLIYSGSITVDKDMTIKAIAVADGYRSSEVANFTYTVKEKNSLWGEVDPEEIPEKGIPEGIWIAGVKDSVFTGVAVKPVVHVYDGKKLLREKKDYTIAYRNNIKVASATGITDMATAKTMKTPTVIITGKGNYGDKIEQYFSITSKNINDEDVVADDIVCKYAKNKVQKVVPTITYQGKKLVKGKDFDVLFEDTAAGAYKEVGVYSIVVTGKNNFEGTRTIKLVITQKLPVGKLVVKKIADQSFTGEAVKPVLDVRYAGKVLTEGVDYRISFDNNVRCGEAHAIIKGLDRFYGERRVSFKIVEPYRNGKYDIALDNQKVMEYRFADVNEYVKGGCKPEVTVFCDGKVLVEGTDYAVAYKNFAKADDLVKVPTITITGKGQYKGKHEETYKIVQKDITTKAMLTSENEVRMLGADSENTNILFVAADKVYNAKKNGYTTKLMVYDFNGVAMKAGVDFDKNVEYRYKEKTVLADGTVRNAGALVESEDIMAMGTVLTVTINGIGNYKGSSTAEYRLIEKAMDISGANAKVNTTKILQYTGKNIELTESDIEVKLRNEFVASSNYRIIGYRNNRKKGSAEVMISGIGNLGGLKVIKFPIIARVLKF